MGSFGLETKWRTWKGQIRSKRSLRLRLAFHSHVWHQVVDGLNWLLLCTLITARAFSAVLGIT
jgi:hypothetical protein